MEKAAILQSNGKRSPLRLTLQRATTITTTTNTKAAARGKPQPQRVEEREQNDFSMKCSTIQFTAKLVITPAWSTTPTKNFYRAAAFLIPHTSPPPTTCTPKYNQKLLPTASPCAVVVVVVVHCQVQNVFKPVAINDTHPSSHFTCPSLLPGHTEGRLCWHLLRLSRAWVSA